MSSVHDIPRKIGRLNELLGEAVALSKDGGEGNDRRDHLSFTFLRENVRHSTDQDSQKSVKSRTLTSGEFIIDI